MRNISYSRPACHVNGFYRNLRINVGFEGYCVYRYLQEAPASNCYGLFRLPLAEACDDLGITMHKLMACLEDLAEHEYILWDVKTRVVYIVGELRRQWGANGVGAIGDKHLRAAKGGAMTLIDSPVARQFVVDYRLDVDLESLGYPRPDTPSRYSMPILYSDTLSRYSPPNPTPTPTHNVLPGLPRADLPPSPFSGGDAE